MFVSRRLAAAKTHDLMIGLARSHRREDIQNWVYRLGNQDVEKLVEFCFYLTIFQRASDLHIKPNEKEVVVLTRKAGVLSEQFSFSASWYPNFLRLMKQRCNLPPHPSGTILEGRVVFPFEQQPLSLRVSIVPTLFGDKIVFRVLNHHKTLMTLDELGMDANLQERYEEVLSGQNGVVLLCGSAGSGKTTTLYASLLWLFHHAGKQNIATVEDPVEYVIENVNQTQVNSNSGVSFANAIRAILRQDPNILAIGEIRDPETARVALQAGLAGHLVLTTFHAGNPVHAIARLKEFGASSETLSMSIAAILHQRLTGKSCRECRGAGCDGCGGRGRVGLSAQFDLLLLPDGIPEEEEIESPAAV